MAHKIPGIKIPYFNLPNDLNPTEYRCIQFQVPDDLEWIIEFRSALFNLATWNNWERTGDESGKIVADQWRDILNAVDWLGDCGVESPDCEECFEILPSHQAVGWYPNHPILTPDHTGIFEVPPWYTNVIDPITLPTDVLLNPAAIANIGGIESYAGEIPSFTVYFNGVGQVDLRLVARPLGGWCYVFPDGNPLVGKAVDLEWNGLDSLVGTGAIEIIIGLLQGELTQTQTVTHEVDFETPGPHTLTAWFFPKLEAEFPPLGYGGGLRSVQFCGTTLQLEDAPMDYTLTCNEGVVKLLLNGQDKSIIDLAECGVVGPPGEPGVDGVDGEPGVDGVDGEPGVDGVDGEDAMSTYFEARWQASVVEPNLDWARLDGTLWSNPFGYESVLDVANDRQELKISHNAQSGTQLWLKVVSQSFTTVNTIATLIEVSGSTETIISVTNIPAPLDTEEWINLPIRRGRNSGVDLYQLRLLGHPDDKAVKLFIQDIIWVGEGYPPPFEVNGALVTSYPAHPILPAVLP